MVKDFIYFDTDYLQSYVAQIDEGLVFKKYFEKNSGNSEQMTRVGEQEKNHFSASGSVGVVKGDYSRDITSPYNNYDTVVSESGRQLLDYVMHDNIYDIFIKDAETKKTIVPNPIVGKYITIKNNYDFIDLSYYKEIFSHNIFAKLVKEKDNASSRETDFNEILDAFLSILPSSCFLLMGTCIVPIKIKYLRETTKEVKFKYSGKITLIGKVTSSFTKIVTSPVENPNVIQATRELDSTLFDVLNSLGFSNVRFIVSPIVLYF